ncbi:hypothetical protein, partial [Actinomadura sp. 7K534]|uniref:hypothetical protein n=1 Tax=Actinomadura sp. 7K534 TaxID=2530366 RepID=UPI001A9D9CC6
PVALDHLVAELLAKKPGDRPPEARTVAARLRAITAPHEHTPAAPHEQTLEQTAPAPPAQRSRTRSPGQSAGNSRTFVALLVVIPALVVAAFLVVLVNPGGALGDEGAHSEAPSCSDLRPASLSDAEPGRLRSDADGADCGWEREMRRGRQYLRVRASRVGTKLWGSAPERARQTLAEGRVKGGWTDRKYSEPHPGQDTYFHYDRSGGIQDYTVVFRDSNLIVTVRLTTTERFFDPSDLRHATLDFATEIHDKIKRTPAPTGRPR